MGGKSLTWAFGMHPLKAKGGDVLVSKDHEKHQDRHGFNAMLALADFKPECRASMFEMIDRALKSSTQNLKYEAKFKI